MKENWWEGLERIGMRPGVERIAALLSRLGDPQTRYPIIHVAGTNGKGSTASLVTSALMSQGYRVGLTISPDLGQINERVTIDQVPIHPDLWDSLGQEIEAAGEILQDIPTFFEAITALAFLAFARQQVDVAVVEVGLGGRLDATNVIPSPILSIITPIAFDHQERLGSTITAIAYEKAGILKPGTRLVLAKQPFHEADEMVKSRAEELDIPIVEPSIFGTIDGHGVTWCDPEMGEMRVPLLGAYQIENVGTARAAVGVLHELGWVTDLGRVKDAWASVRWPGRFQVVERDPLWVIDGAHNEHGISGLVNTLQRQPWAQYRWHLIFGVLADKPGDRMLSALLPYVESVTLTHVPSERGADPEPLLKQFQGVKSMRMIRDPLDAVRRLQGMVSAGGPDAVLVCGSLSLLSYLNQRQAFHPIASTIVEKG